jgi:diguanylate cyclase (GGDEF)-like protein
MHSQQNVGFNDSYMAAHRFDRRLAVIDRFYLTSVTNRAFNDYFGNATYGCITEFVNPDEKESFIEFIDGFSGEEIEKCFLLKNSDGEYRLNLVKLTAFEGEPVLRNIDIEMVDIDSVVEVNYRICDDISRERVIMGLTGEYVFTYSELTGDIKIVRYEASSREVIVRLPLDEWREYMADGRVAMEDMVELDSLINCIRTYMSDFCVKLTTSMRTLGKVMEKVKFIGTVYTKYTGENIVTGRIVLADGVNSMGNIVEVVDELTMDSLTKVYNKKTITEYASRLVKQDTVNRISIAILDIDYFKQVNDRYGHLYGDKVLTRVAKKLKEVVGEDGVVGRIGGDEFMIVLKGINDDYALRGILRAIRTQVKWEFKNDYENFQVTTSIGVAFSPNNGHDYEELFKKADFCLYVAKEKGRDRYVFFRDEIHRESYQNSLNKKDKIINDGREMRELRYLTDIMVQYNHDKKAAVMAMLEHMLSMYKIDNISIYKGKDLKNIVSVGTPIKSESDMSYIDTDGFKILMGDKTYIASSFINKNQDVAPEFVDEMRRRGIHSTIQCFIGTKDDVKGLLTINRMKAASQWAEYEIECSIITATLINMII